MSTKLDDNQLNTILKVEDKVRDLMDLIRDLPDSEIEQVLSNEGIYGDQMNVIVTKMVAIKMAFILRSYLISAAKQV